MASVVNRGGKWYLRFKDSTGRWVQHVSTARSKTEARRLAEEMESKAARQRLGLEASPADPKLTLGELMEWWMKTYPTTERSQKARETFIRKHFVDAKIARTPVLQVAPGMVESFLQAKNGLSPATINNLRASLYGAFSMARRAGKWTGPNPVADVRRRKVPKRLPEYLTVQEVPLVLDALDDRWRPLFATAIFTGLRKGELLGLRKVDVNFDLGLIAVCRSYDRDTTKNGRAEVVPISRQLRPYLEQAVKNSPSELVFPAEDGLMMSHEILLQKVLRRAMGRAGIVLGYSQVCRRKDCSHRQLTPTGEPLRCPKCNMKLWPRPKVRPIRFHALRHTTASLLMMAGANPAAVQRIMRHSDPRMTTEVYGHLSPDYLRSEVERLRFAALPEGQGPKALPPPSEVVIEVKRHVLTVEEVARKLRLHKATVYKMIERGEIPHARVSNAIRVDPADLDRVLRARKLLPPAEPPSDPQPQV
jgi:excisionase family DNA binding protein